MSFHNIELKIEGRVAIILVSRPAVLNALDSRTLGELKTAFQHCSDDSRLGAVILTGAGEKAFVAGADIRELQRLDAVAGREFALHGQALFGQIERLAKPVIAAVHGYCLGGGCEIALACHIRIAAENAVFGQPEVKLGLIPGYGGTQRLSRLVGKGMALQLILSGGMIDAQEALRIGLVNRVVPREELLTHCHELAECILKNSPIAVSLAMESVISGGEMSLEQGLAYEAGLFGLACSTGDKREGTEAFLEKRPPRFPGNRIEGERDDD